MADHLTGLYSRSVLSDVLMFLPNSRLQPPTFRLTRSDPARSSELGQGSLGFPGVRLRAGLDGGNLSA